MEPPAHGGQCLSTQFGCLKCLPVRVSFYPNLSHLLTTPPAKLFPSPSSYSWSCGVLKKFPASIRPGSDSLRGMTWVGKEGHRLQCRRLAKVIISAFPAFPPTPSPVRVSLSTRVETVSPIQSAEMEYRVNMRWSLSWRDPRIGLDDGEECLDVDTAYAILPESVASQIWIPDVYIVNAKYSGVKTFNGKLFNLVLHPNSRLSLNFILNATIACAMNFEYYPHDVQNCPMIIQSCKGTIK